MPRGFFHGSELLSSKAPISSIPKCGACQLYKKCQSPKMEPSGKGKKRVLIIGEAPGETEDEEGRQFVGKTGSHLSRTLQKLGVDMRADCWLTNALICRPPNNKIDDPRKIDYCRPNLIKTIKDLEPEIIIPLGGTAVKSLIAHLWKDDVGGISRWLGWKIPEQTLNAWICPTWHPSYVTRTDYGTSKRQNEVLQMIWEHHLKEAFAIRGRPWKKIPDYKSQVEIILDPKKAAKVLRSFIEAGGVVAFDYETNRLKPDNPNAMIVCCSVCWEGKRTISFPWMGEAVVAMSELLLSKRIKKIASNMKFEDRWTRARLLHGVRGWLWDTMVNAHIIDNRHDITSIKFQSFVMLGAPSYDDHIKPFLSTKKKVKQVNQILEEIDFRKLLLYCGLDSLLEFIVGKKQMGVLNYDERCVSRGSEEVS